MFVGLTFGLTWLLNLAMHLGGGLDHPGVVTALQFQMLLPAVSAIVLGLRWFPVQDRPPPRGRGAGGHLGCLALAHHPMGYNYPGHPLLGVALMTLHTTGLAVVLGYAVLRYGSVLLSAYLHGLNNQVVAYIVAIGFRPFDAAYAFGIGTYGIVTLAIVAGIVLLDPIWRGSGSSLVEPEPLLDPRGS